MINSLEYTKENIEVKIDGHRHVLESAKTLPSGQVVTDSDLSNELPIIKAVAEAVFATSVRTEGAARFNESTGLVKFNGQVITPESDLTALPEDIQAFCQAIRTPSTIKTFNALKEPEYETDDVPDKKIEMRNGKPVLVDTIKKVVRTKQVRVKNEDGSDAFQGKEPLFYNEPILKS